METNHYGKPNMTSLPNELGTRIFNQILNSPKPDRQKMHKESMRLEKKMKTELEKHRNGSK